MGSLDTAQQLRSACCEAAWELTSRQEPGRKTMQCLSVHVSGIVSVLVWQVWFHRQSAVWLARPAEEQADDFCRP